MRLKTFLFTGVLLSLTLFPLQSFAFAVTDKQAYQLNESTYLFIIEFELGYNNAAAYSPIKTTLGEKVQTQKPNLRYTLTGDDDEPVENGEFASVVLSGAEIKNGYYYIPEGEKKSFTLLSLYRTHDSENIEPTRLQVNQLGNVIYKDEEHSYVKVPPPQIKDYTVHLIK